MSRLVLMLLGQQLQLSHPSIKWLHFYNLLMLFVLPFHNHYTLFFLHCMRIKYKQVLIVVVLVYN